MDKRIKMALYKRFEVVKKVQEAKGIISLYLKPADGTSLSRFQPGQHLLFKIHVPGQQIPAFRYYSFSDAYHPDYYRVSIKRECVQSEQGVRMGLCSSYISDCLQPGAIVEAKGPSGEFYIVPKEEHPLVLIAGGIGITPLLSMLKSIALENPSREVYFFYGVNEQSDHCFQQELNDLKKRSANFRIVTFYTKVQPDDIKGVHYDHNGYMSIKVFREVLHDLNREYYICGPAPMMQFIISELEKAGVSKEKIHTESFQQDINAWDVEPEAEPLVPPAVEKEEGLFIDFKRSGRKLLWDKRYRSILEFAEAHDIDISSGCLFGDCGTCMTKVHQGEIKYNHPTMVQPDKGKCLPCSCVPSSHLILEA
jgi:ferredoxin-NADP reductase